jgi:hypothetical protein
LPAKVRAKQSLPGGSVYASGQEIGSDDDDAGDLAVRETKLFRKMVLNELRKGSFSGAD